MSKKEAKWSKETVMPNDGSLQFRLLIIFKFCSYEIFYSFYEYKQCKHSTYTNRKVFYVFIMKM